MADEKKTYLVNIESNLEKYIKEAAEAKKKVEELTIENLKMKASGTATYEEQEKNTAALRSAQKEYSNAKKSVDQATLANKAQSGSYEQLYRQWSLAQTQLKLMGGAYTTNAQGVRVLSEKYIEQKKVVEDAKRSLDSFGKGIADNRLNVGNYSEAIDGAIGGLRAMPGPIGGVIAGIKSMTLAAKAFIATPIGAILAAIVAVISLLVKAFKNSQPLMDLFDKTSAVISATFKVLLDRISNFAEFLGSIFSKELRESRKEAKALNDELIGIEETMTRREKRELRRANRKGIIEEIKEEAKAARDLKAAEQAVSDAEIAFIQRKQELRLQIQENINAAKDENLTNREKLAGLDEAIKMQEELTAKEVGFAKERARISQEQVDQGNSTREELRKNEELQAAANETEAAGLKAQKKILSERYTLINLLTKAEQDAIKKVEDAKIKAAEEEVKRLEKEAKDALDALHKELADKLEFIEAQKQAEIDWDNWMAEKALINAENRRAIREIEGETEYAMRSEELERLREEEIRAAEKTGADVRLINDKYDAAQLQMDRIVAETKMEIYSEFAGSIANIFGEQTAIGRIAAVAQATINTYLAATRTLADPTIPSTFARVLAMVAVIGTGLAQVAKIVSTKSGLPGDSGGGGTAPTAISSSLPAIRTFATPVGSSVLTQQSLSQSQVNAIPNQNAITAEDIAAAVAKLPAPIVTVEDINARVNASAKVAVRATI